MLNFISDVLKIIYKPIQDIIGNFTPVNVVEVAIIAVIIFVFYIRFIRGTQSEKLLRGIMMLVGTLVFSKILILLNLQILGRFLETLVSIVLFGLVVIFQPELRRFLGYLGQPGFLSKNIFSMENEKSECDFIEEISDAVRYLSKSRTGALMVIQNTASHGHYFEVGTKLNALVSTELLLTIFHPNTPLHDGAVVINNERIVSAGVLLPLTEDPKLSWQYGTRHRAAIGMSETSDDTCIVVSEETGNISIVEHGVLKKMESSEELKKVLQELCGVASSEAHKVKTFRLNNLFKTDFSRFPNILGRKSAKK